MGGDGKARLSLKGLEQLSDASATSLSKFRGLLQLPSELQAKVDSFKNG